MVLCSVRDCITVSMWPPKGGSRKKGGVETSSSSMAWGASHLKTQEVKAGGAHVRGQPGLHSATLLWNQKYCSLEIALGSDSMEGMAFQEGWLEENTVPNLHVAPPRAEANVSPVASGDSRFALGEEEQGCFRS